MNPTEVEIKTGSLFGSLFKAYDDKNFLRSVDLFRQRFEDNGLDTAIFRKKKCLDLGCGRGRYSIALSLLGASEVIGVDISKEAISDAQKRVKALGLQNVTFQHQTAEDLPFPSAFFDCVIFSGVLMHMENPDKGIAEIARVLKPGGLVYMLVYATEGIRWPLINLLRNFSHEIGFENFDKVLAQTEELDVNKRRTYLDDLFVPIIDFYSEERLFKLLTSNGFTNIQRWKKGRLDHEENLDAYYDDLFKLQRLYEKGVELRGTFTPMVHSLFVAGSKLCKACTEYVDMVRKKVKSGELSEDYARKMVIGQGHHRLTAIKN